MADPFPPVDWLDWTPDEYAVDAAATALHFERWFRNVVAQAQGAAGAPRTRIGALQRLTAGDEVRSRRDAQSAGAGNKFDFQFMQVGSIRLTLEHAVTTSVPAQTSTITVTRSRNGVNTAVATWATGSTGWVPRTVDIDVLPGDGVSVTNAGGTNVQVRNIRLQTDGEDLWPGASAYLEGNTYA